MRIEMSEYGPPDVLRAVEVEPQEPGLGEVRVAVVAAGVDPSDLAIRAGTHPHHGTWPYVPGVELVGTIEAVGPGTRLPVGERVITMMQRLGGIPAVRPGGYQARAVVPESTLALLPRSLSRMDAAALGLPAVSAFLALEALELRAGHRVLVLSGPSPVGQMAIRLARAAGCEVISTASGSAAVKGVKQAGADAVIDTSVDAWHRGVEPVDRVLELGSAATIAGSLAMLKPGGRMVIAGNGREGTLSVPLRDLVQHKTLRGWTPEQLDVDDVQSAVDGLSWFVGRGMFAVPEPRTYALAEAAQAHAAMESGEVDGRVLLLP